MSTERPILMNGEMVKALLAGSKSQTRRLMKPQPFKLCGITYWKDFSWCPGANQPDIASHCPLGIAGSHLWVRETWQDGEFAQNEPKGPVYRATDPNWETCEGWKWKPSIFMPRSASRITLEILEVRVQRLQDISEDDAKAEGVGECQHGLLIDEGCNYRGGFQNLWESMNAKRVFGWAENPWVWCISFRRIKP